MLSFASELKALLRQPGFSREVDLDALEAYLAFNSIPAPLTIFREARKLPARPPADRASGARRRCAATRARARSPAGRERPESEQELARELRERLRDSVRAHLVADVPVGVMLSGGIDSSALAALAARESSYRVSTFSIGFEERSFNELELARLVAELYGTDHHELIVRPDAVELLPRLAEAFDEPFADSSALPTYLVSQLAAGTVKVALSGEGGDELFGGYYTYVADTLAPAHRAASPPRCARWSSGCRARRPRSASTTRPSGSRAPRTCRRSSATTAGRRSSRRRRAPRCSTAAAASVDPLDIYRARYAETEGADELARLQDVDIGIYLADDLLVKTDRASMAHSLEARVPFCDPVVAELALALPRSHEGARAREEAAAARGGRDAAARARSCAAASRASRSRPRPGCAASWSRSPARCCRRERLRAQGFFRPDTVTALLDRPRRRAARTSAARSGAC